MLPAQEPGGMMPAQEQVEMASIDADSAAIEQTDAATVEQTDTVLPDPDPEWYVAPLNYDSVMARHNAPRRANATNYHIDSVLTYDINSVLTDVSIYEYGDTIRTITWAVNADGTRTGKALVEEYTTATIVYNCSYDWDNTTNTWKGASKTVKEYNAKGKMIANTTFAWVNNAWVEDVKLTYAYDASNREIEFLTYNRNKSTNQLELSKARYREWYNSSKTTLDIQYTAYTNGTPTAGNKTECTYDASGTMLTKTYYASFNGDWVASSGSTMEIWEYSGTKKTYYEKHTGSNTGWVKNNKEIWEFNNAAGKQTLYEKYGVNNNEWAITNRDISGYNEYNNQTLVENYTFNKTTGVKTGAKKEEYTLKDNTTLQTVKIQYKWVAASSSWVNNIKTVKAYEGSKTTDNCVYNWINDEWVGVYTRTKTTYSGSNPIDVITMSWSADIKDWVNSGRTETEYTGTNKTKETTSIWQNDAWQTTGRTDYHYTNGKNDTTTIYTSVGGVLTPSKRTVNTYNSAGTNIMTHIATWTDNQWTLTSMTRKDIIDHIVDGQRQTLSAEWKCGSDSVWIGQKKDTTLYSTTGKTLYTASYKGWKDNDWIPTSKSEFYYDEQDRKIDEQSFKWSNGWVGNIRNEYGYDEQGRTNMIATYVGWNNTTNWWVGSNKTEYSFGNSGETDFYIIYNWGGSDWVYSTRQSFTYDGSGNEIGQVIEQYINKEWVNKTKYEKEYKGGNQTKNNEYTWLNNEWVYRTRNESYYDEDAQGKLRREIQGTWNNGELISYAENLYYYNVDFPFYTIRFENYDGTLIESYSVQETKKPTYTGETPARPATEQYTYTFKGWTPAIVTVTGDATYTAEYDSVVNRYRITWLNADDVEVAVDSLEYGAMPSHEDVVKPSTSEWAYLFAGWSPAIVTVTGDATYKAQLDSIQNGYRITWLDADDTELAADSLSYGAMPSHEYVLKANTAEWTYSFVGWTPEIAAVTGDATYKAQIDSVRNSYLITFKNGEETLQSTQVAYGSLPVYEGEEPTKQGDAQYTYSFNGWDAEIAAVTGEATYNATFTSTVNTYTITWLMDDGTKIDEQEMAYGATPTHADAHKDNTAQYTITFVGWDKDFAAVTGDETYTAVFDSVVNTYTITFYFDNGVTVLDQQVFEYGQMPSTNFVPSRESDAQYSYTFTGWSPELVPVTGDASYVATFEAMLNQYTIIFRNYDGTELQNTKVDYGTMPEYTGETPTRKGNMQYSYDFIGWSPELDIVTGDATYTAVYEQVLTTYTIIFYDEDGVTVLDSVEVEYGKKPSTTVIPTKEDDEQYTYTFAGWSPTIVAATRNTSYTATYTATLKSQGLWDVETDEKAQKVMIDGVMYIIRGGKKYGMDGAIAE